MGRGLSSLLGYARLRAQSPIRIAAGEEICDVKEFQQLMDVGGIDVVQVDVTRVGGLARAKRIGWDSAERHRQCVNHSYKTGVNIAASLHFLAVANGFFNSTGLFHQVPVHVVRSYRHKIRRERGEVFG